jgi:hypothetical protein
MNKDLYDLTEMPREAARRVVRTCAPASIRRSAPMSYDR